MATASETAPKTMSGGCLCGAIRYTVTGDPFFSCICCCIDCQKVSGAPFMAILGFTKDNFVIHNAEAAVKHIKHNKALSAKGTPKNQSFCQDCGSVVFGGTYGEQEWYTVYSGTLDEGFRDEHPPTFAMFVKDRPKWARIEGIAEFEKMPPPVPGA
jgi:hypothetical protein